MSAEAISTWKESNDTMTVEKYGLVWTSHSARTFVDELANMFRAYNGVLWEQFHYCPTCSGQCCVVDASDIRAFDLLAIVLLEQHPPALAERINTTPHGCIYLNGMTCSWPDQWRTIKCWTFYCLGSGPFDTNASLGQLYKEVTEQLQAVVEQSLPTPLRNYEQRHNLSLSQILDDPVAFSNLLHEALRAIFVDPLAQHVGVSLLDPTSPNHSTELNKTPVFLDDEFLDEDLDPDIAFLL